MKSELQNKFARMGVPSSWETFAMQLANFAIVDVGKIESVKDGIATVQTYYVRGKQTKRVQAEIVMIGNLSGYLCTIDIGQPCIIFYPRSPSYSLAEEKIDVTFGVYNEQAAKCLPVTTYNAEQLVSISHAADTLSLSTASYTLNLEPSSVSFLSDMFQMMLTDKEWEGIWGGGVGECKLTEQGGLERISGRSYDDVSDKVNWKNKVEQKPDGSVVIQAAGLVNSSTSESFGKSKITLDNQGNIKIEAGIDEQGKAQTSLSIGADGNLKIDTEKKYSIKGVNGVVVDGNGGKVSIKNNAGDLKSILDSFADNLKADLGALKTAIDTLQTAGSPANHTVIPGQLESWKTQFDTNIAQFKTDVEGVFE